MFILHSVAHFAISFLVYILQAVHETYVEEYLHHPWGEQAQANLRSQFRDLRALRNRSSHAPLPRFDKTNTRTATTFYGGQDSV